MVENEYANYVRPIRLLSNTVTFYLENFPIYGLKKEILHEYNKIIFINFPLSTFVT